MARSINEVYTGITNDLKLSLAAVGININPDNWSSVNFVRLLCYAIATAICIHEQLWDAKKDELNSILYKSAASSPLWLQNKAFTFQYSATNPQYVNIINGVPAYPTINESYRIITACSIQSTLSNVVKIKVAKNNPLESLSSLEKNALQNYYDTIGSAGINYQVISLNPDKLYIEGSIYYKGAYSSTIQSLVINAINSYLYSLSKERFGGDILLSDIKRMIRNIDGVNDVVLKKVSCRYDSQSIFTGIELVDNYDELNRKYTMESGYIIEETSIGYTFSDTLTFIAE